MPRSVSARLAALSFVAGLLCQAVGCSGLSPHPFPQWNEGPGMSEGLDVYSGMPNVAAVETAV